MRNDPGKKAAYGMIKYGFAGETRAVEHLHHGYMRAEVAAPAPAHSCKNGKVAGRCKPLLQKVGYKPKRRAGRAQRSHRHGNAGRA